MIISLGSGSLQSERRGRHGGVEGDSATKPPCKLNKSRSDHHHQIHAHIQKRRIKTPLAYRDFSFLEIFGEVYRVLQGGSSFTDTVRRLLKESLWGHRVLQEREWIEPGKDDVTTCVRQVWLLLVQGSCVNFHSILKS